VPSPLPESLPQALLRSVETLARTVRESSLGVTREVGCTRGTVAIVRILQRRGTLPVTDVAHALHVDVSVASRQVSHLVDDGLVERDVDHDDRRVRSVRLSPAGHALADQVRAVLDRRADEVFADWSPAQLAAATAALDRLTATLSHLAPLDHVLAPA